MCAKMITDCLSLFTARLPRYLCDLQLSLVPCNEQESPPSLLQNLDRADRSAPIQAAFVRRHQAVGRHRSSAAVSPVRNRVSWHFPPGFIDGARGGALWLTVAIQAEHHRKTCIVCTRLRLDLLQIAPHHQLQYSVPVQIHR